MGHGRRYILVVAITCIVVNVFGQKLAKGLQESINAYKPKWTKDPFDRQLFVENKGQFNNDIITTDRILFQAILGDVKAYFTAKGVIYRYDEKRKKNQSEGNEPENIEIVSHYSSYTWQGADSNTTCNAQDEQSYYYIYPTGKASSVNVNVFKKILYKNIYPGIDIEYSFLKGKQGIKYSVIIHPGGDASLVKLKYSGINKVTMNANGDILLKSNVGEITDHMPYAYYENSRSTIACSYKLNGTEESFTIGKNTTDESIIIDPWSTNPNFVASYDRAYDVDYDNNGNVYAYGSNNPFQLTKFNSAGVQQWTYNMTSFSDIAYGDFSVDRGTGTSYVCDGITVGGKPHVLKINSNGTLTGSTSAWAQGYLGETWRMVYDPCNREIVFGGGSQGQRMLDTNMGVMDTVYPHGLVEAYDNCLLAIDQSTGNTFYLSSKYQSTHGTRHDTLFSVPTPALTPMKFCVPSTYQFIELLDNRYLLGTIGCGMNGMAVSPNWLYMYDGSTLSKVVKTTGATSASLVINTPTYGTCVADTAPYINVYWGGLDADECDNAYVGFQTLLQVYDSSPILMSASALPDTVFDVVLGANSTIVYACGIQYVTEMVNKNPPSLTIKSSSTPAKCGSCNGTATSGVLACGNPLTGATYYWNTSPVQTTQTATNLCSGKYSVTITYNCGQSITDTVLVGSSGTSGGLTFTRSVINIKCFDSSGAASITGVTGGTGPYSYLWSNGKTTSSISGLAAGTYTVTVADTSCHTDTAIFTLTQPTQLKDSLISFSNMACNTKGSIAVSGEGGTAPYTYAWSNGQTTSGITGLNAGTYSCTVTDANGCTQVKAYTIMHTGGPIATISGDTTIAYGGSAQLISSGGGTYLWTPTNNLSCTNCADPIATPSVTTHYCVIVSDTSGCTDSTCTTVFVDNMPCGDVFVPNAFSPNGDRENDLECVYGGCIETMDFVIFDRWGNEVFRTNDSKQCWDGKYNGVLMNTGVFVYYLKAILINGDKVDKKGNITLVR